VTPGPVRLAIAASAEFPDLRPDWPLLRDALASRGIAASTEVWTDPAVRWSEFDLVVANGAWDNIHRPGEFAAWAERTAHLAPLVNSPATLRWGMDKHYLATLADAGVATVPTLWLGPTEGTDPEIEVVLPEGDMVVKPTVSGGGFQTARYRPSEHADARAHIRHLLESDRDVMVQPYVGAVDAYGEGGLMFLAGQFSHAIRKGPLLRQGAGPQSALWALEDITSLEPTAAQLETALAALMHAEQLLGPTTYARVDVVALADGTPAVLELELVDPALFFEIEPAAANRFADVLAQLIA
jgi:glutathione synthase/RimK-type ligase-like ATP-grasp enzyme